MTREHLEAGLEPVKAVENADQRQQEPLIATWQPNQNRNERVSAASRWREEVLAQNAR